MSRRNNRNSKRGVSDSGSTVGNTTVKGIFDSVLTSGQLSVEPKPTTYSMGTGRVVGTEIYIDRGFGAKVSVAIPFSQPNWEGVAKTHWFQDSVTTDDTSVDNVLGNFIKTAYNLIVREGASHTGKMFAIRDTTTVDTGTFTSFPGWMDNYALSFTILRGLQSCLAGGGLNFTMSLIANSVMTRIMRLTADLNRLYTYSMAPGIIKCLDALCGVKYIDENNIVYIAGIGGPINALSQLDLEVPGNIDTLLTLAENNLASLGTGTGGIDSTINVGDAQQIANIMGWAYGPAQIRLDKGISNDPIEYAIQRFQGVSGIGAVNNFTAPNINISPIANSVPIYVPRGASSMGLLATLLRPAVYSVDPVAGVAKALVPSQIGLFDNLPGGAVAQGTSMITYNQLGVAASAQATSGANLNYSNPFMSVLPWSANAADPVLANSYAADTREFDRYDRVWLSKEWMIDETLYYLEDAFLTPIRMGGFKRA